MTDSGQSFRYWLLCGERGSFREGWHIIEFAMNAPKKVVTKSKKSGNRVFANLEKNLKPLEGILVFDQALRPVLCSETIKPLCQQICKKSGICVLEKGEHETPELFNIVRRFRIDCERLSHTKSSPGGAELVSNAIVYLSQDGDYTIRCVRLGKKSSVTPKAISQISLIRGIALNSLDFEIIDRKFSLTPSELKVLKHILGGLNTNEIADRLTISNATVKTHVRRILEKLGISHRSLILSRLISTLLFFISCSQ
jgi:DNA-binding CsgD family transcriptional regulator